MVNGIRMTNRIYELPDTTVNEADRTSLALDCAVITAAARNLSDKKYVWYRNERERERSELRPRYGRGSLSDFAEQPSVVHFSVCVP